MTWYGGSGGQTSIIVRPLEWSTLQYGLDPLAAGRGSNRTLQLLNEGGSIGCGWIDGWSSIHQTSWINYSDILAHGEALEAQNHLCVDAPKRAPQLSRLRQVGPLTVLPLCPSSVLPHECKSAVRPSSLGLKIECGAEESFVSGWRLHAAGMGTGQEKNK